MASPSASRRDLCRCWPTTSAAAHRISRSWTVEPCECGAATWSCSGRHQRRAAPRAGSSSISPRIPARPRTSGPIPAPYRYALAWRTTIRSSSLQASGSRLQKTCGSNSTRSAIWDRPSRPLLVDRSTQQSPSQSRSGIGEGSFSLAPAGARSWRADRTAGGSHRVARRSARCAPRPRCRESDLPNRGRPHGGGRCPSAARR